MIYDCFNFFDELELLEIRFNILDKYVDKFVVVEANETFMGKSKPLFFEENKDRFKKWSNKIIHLSVTDFPNDKAILEKALLSPNTGGKEHWWVREFYQKEYLIKALIACNMDDLIFISDLDEIWNPDTCLSLNITGGKVYRPIQKSYMYFLNGVCGDGMFTGSRFATYSTLLKYGPNHFRTEREVKGEKIENGGWHFAWLSKEDDKYGDNHPDVPIKKHYIQSNPIKKDNNGLPLFILENKEKFKHLLLA